MRYAVLVVGIAVFLVGLLWLLQGLGIVTMKPLLCFANCTPVEGPALTWAVAGFAALLIGLVAIGFGIRRRTK